MKVHTQFNGKTCLVTGAGSDSGIGFAAAKIIGKLGGKVAITSTTERIYKREKELRELGIDAKGYIADLMNFDQAEQLVQQVFKDYGKVDILINNAGMGQVGSPEKFIPFVELDTEEWNTSISRNLSTCFHVTRAALPQMIENRYGRIVNVSSVTGPLVSNPGESGYSAAKAAMVGMSRGIAIEVAKHNITVNNVAPGWITTGSQTEHERIAGENTPMGRNGQPEEVGHLITFLASEQASYITGQLFVVDGGNTIQDYKGPREHYY
ncbi:SDR family NAD(P)-dependent oxidoreductase [Pseudobacillus wudalianchiensis]|uniref:Short-chain dehydrogenase n=1 Tax=Pseudobacillus wudalianchiensis TaxID=1743143 RepID=A0A1B9AMR6_9BACI|nr:SDR family NAD(P)-dependent oxidoreductase [Bacillus wudalianchiensis]OCA85150.1 short-chain dehydrogenase [Bacillus wudalianchiensis]